MTAGSPQDGDLVRAVEASREAEIVEGVLRLRHVPSLDYVQVHVIGPPGYFFRVDPASVEVIRRGVEPVSADELEDPLRGDPGWRRITDLDTAIAEGLVPPVKKRPNISWSEMEDRLDRVTAPLVAAGWDIVYRDREASDQYGDSVFLDVERDELSMQLQYFEDDYLAVWPLEASDEDDDDLGCSESLCEIEDASVERSRAVFAEQGWLDRR